MAGEPKPSLFRRPLTYIGIALGVAVVSAIPFLSRSTDSDAKDAAATPEAIPAAPADTGDAELATPEARQEVEAPVPGPEVVEAQTAEPEGPELNERQEKHRLDFRLNPGDFDINELGELESSNMEIIPTEDGAIFMCTSDCAVDVNLKTFVTLTHDEGAEEFRMGHGPVLKIPYGHMADANLTFKISVDVATGDGIYYEKEGQPGVLDTISAGPYSLSFVVNLVDRGVPVDQLALSDFIGMITRKVTNVTDPSPVARLSAQPDDLSEVLAEAMRVSLGLGSFMRLRPKTKIGKAKVVGSGINEEKLEKVEQEGAGYFDR